jgi:hypothetical protein
MEPGLDNGQAQAQFFASFPDMTKVFGKHISEPKKISGKEWKRVARNCNVLGPLESFQAGTISPRKTTQELPF